VNGAVLTLFAAGHIRVAQDGKVLAGPKELPPTQIGKAAFYKEDEPPTMIQRIAVRSLLTTVEIAYEPGQEGATIPALLQQLKDLSGRVGGASPLPEQPNVDYIDALLSLGGNQRFRAVADDHERLIRDFEHWSAADSKRQKRETDWADLQHFLRHASELPVEGTVNPAVSAILDGRQLLDEPNPLTPLLGELTAALRSEILDCDQQLAAAQQNAIAELEGWERWHELDPNNRESILAEARLTPNVALDVVSDAQLFDALESTPLDAWQDRISLVPSRRDQAQHRAALSLEPESVTVDLPSATIKSIDDLDAYVDELRVRVRPYLDADKTVII